MTEIIDPCNEREIPDSPDPSGPGVNPSEPRALETPGAAFPVRQVEVLEQATVRDSAIIEKCLWNNFINDPSKLRFPQNAPSISHWQERPELIDSFRYVTGKNWRFTDGNLVFFNKYYHAQRARGVPFDILIRLEESPPGQELCSFRIDPNINMFESLLRELNSYFRLLPSADFSEIFQLYLSGRFPFTTPLISDTHNWKYDFCFKAPAAFFESEVEQSAIPLVEGVSIAAHYLGGPVREAIPGEEEISRTSAYRFYYNALNPDAVLRPPNDHTQVFFSQKKVSDLTNMATNIAVSNPVFHTETGQTVLNNHIRITLNTRSKVGEPDSLTRLIQRGMNIKHFMNFLINSDIQVDAKNRFVQYLDQSRLGGNENNKQVIDYEPKTYESGISRPLIDDAEDNFHEHYDFNVAQLFDPLTEETRSKSPIPYDRSQYDFQAQHEFEFAGLSQRTQTYKKHRSRTFISILEGQMASSEIVAFRIEKLNLDGEAIQNFYFFNNYEDELLDFIDTQVFYNKVYTYRIYAINAVVGSKYKYSHRQGNPQDVSVLSMPLLSFIETPYFEQQVAMIDKPPMFPQVEVIPFYQESDRVAFRLTSTYGEVVEKPIQILEEDHEKILKMQNNSVNFLNVEEQPERLVHYSSDNAPTEYEVLILDHAPESYQDFSVAQKVSKESNYGSGYIELNLEPNKRYYMTFRASDASGISNPSAVYTLVLNSHIDGVYIQFDEYDMVSLALDDKITFDRILKIDPSPEQMAVDFSKHIEQDNFYTSAPPVSELDLGLEEFKVWNRDYKFRLISRTTGKAIDLNMKYDYKIIIPPPPFNLDDLVYDAITESQEEEQDETAEKIAALLDAAGTEEDYIADINLEDAELVLPEQDSDVEVYDDEGGQRSRVQNRPTETVRERLAREERERRERERIESLRREAASTRNITTVYNYDN